MLSTKQCPKALLSAKQGPEALLSAREGPKAVLSKNWLKIGSKLLSTVLSKAIGLSKSWAHLKSLDLLTSYFMNTELNERMSIADLCARPGQLICMDANSRRVFVSKVQ